MTIKKKTIIIFTTFCIILSFTISYMLVKSSKGTSFEIMSFSNNSSSRMKASFVYFSGRKQKEINLKQDEELTISFNSEITEGKLSIQLLDSTGNVVKEFANTVDQTEKIKASKAEKYKILVQGEKAKGNYEVKWYK
jgi:hypothetical protein